MSSIDLFHTHIRRGERANTMSKLQYEKLHTILPQVVFGFITHREPYTSGNMGSSAQTYVYLCYYIISEQLVGVCNETPYIRPDIYCT